MKASLPKQSKTVLINALINISNEFLEFDWHFFKIENWNIVCVFLTKKY